MKPAEAMSRTRRCALCAALALVALLVGCARERSEPTPDPVYEDDVEAIFDERCADCHGGDDPEGGWSSQGYLGVTACSDASPEVPVVEPAGVDAPLAQTLLDDVHRGVAEESEVLRITGWVAAGAPLRGLSVHGGHILDPRHEDWHGRLAAQDGFAPLRNLRHPEACARCHLGAPTVASERAKPTKVGAAGATPCTQCHRQPEGVLACGTCHGAGARPYPPRSLCAFDLKGGAHEAHVRGGALGLGLRLSCSDCHPRADASLSRTHANGEVDVQVSAPLAGSDASYDAESGRCSVGCHARGGARPEPGWFDDERLGCGDCHASPPDDHYAGPCTLCHVEADAEGTALTLGDPPLHMNGRVDAVPLEGDCGACHGSPGDPWPDTPSHRLHRQSELMAPIACGECHNVPDDPLDPGHLDHGETTPADVVFSGRAVARDREPSIEEGACSDVACHGAGLGGGELVAVWDQTPSTPARADGCTRCHGAPPPPPHSPLDSCAAALCHGAQVAEGRELGITEAGRAGHIDGRIR